MAPLRRARAGADVWIIRKTDRRLQSITRSHSSGEVLRTPPLPITPAAFTRPSRPPKDRSAASTRPRQIAGSRTSPVTTSQAPPRSRTWSATWPRRSARRPAATRLAPSPPSARAQARPMPLEAPVTRTVFPAKRAARVMTLSSADAEASRHEARHEHDRHHQSQLDLAQAPVERRRSQVGLRTALERSAPADQAHHRRDLEEDDQDE